MSRIFCLVSLVLLLAACGDAGPAPVVLTPELTAKLAAADALDGAADHVVGKCASCNLLMAGKSEHTLPVGDYKMQFCSDLCFKAYAGDTTARLQALVLPEGEEDDEPPVMPAMDGAAQPEAAPGTDAPEASEEP